MKTIRFKEYCLKDSDDLIEQTKAMKGDWHEGVDSLGSQGIHGMKKWEKIIDIKSIDLPRLQMDLEFYKLRNALEFKLGYWDIEQTKTKQGVEDIRVFVEVFKIGLTRYKSVESKTGYKKLINVDGVAIIKSLQNKGISKFIYKYLVNELGYTILSDEHQFYGARKLWSRLSKELDVKVDIIDITKKEIITKNVILHHGDYDSDFDKAIWSYNDDKKHLRSVLTKIL
jgi:hypothetical protein